MRTKTAKGSCLRRNPTTNKAEEAAAKERRAPNGGESAAAEACSKKSAEAPSALQLFAGSVSEPKANQNDNQHRCIHTCNMTFIPYWISLSEPRKLDNHYKCYFLNV